MSEDECLLFVRQYRTCRDFLNSVGKWKESGRIEQFEYSQLVAIFGKEHPDTITAMSNLASTLGEQGYLKEAASMKGRAADTWEVWL